MDIRDHIIGNTVSVGTIVGAAIGLLPVVSALVALAYYVIQIRESATWRNWALRRHMKRVARIKAKLAYLESLEWHEEA